MIITYSPLFGGSGVGLRVKSSFLHLKHLNTFSYFDVLMPLMSSTFIILLHFGQRNISLSTLIVPPRDVAVKTISSMQIEATLTIFQLDCFILLFWKNYLVTFVTKHYFVFGVSHYNLLSFHIFQHLSSLSFNTWK